MALEPAADIDITQNGNDLLLSGTLSNLNLFDFITGGASFAVTRKLVDVDLDGDPVGTTDDQLEGAGLLTIALSNVALAVGVSGAGLTVSSGNIGIAVLNAPSDARSWTAVSVKDVTVELDLPGIDATVESFTLEVAEGPTDLDWNTAIDTDPADGFEGADAVNPGAVLETPVDLTITQNGNELLLSGSLTELNILDFITGSADFAVTREAVDAKISASETLENAGLLTIALSELDLTVGVSGVGLTISDGNIGIAILNAPGTDTRTWTAMSAFGLTVTLELPGIEATVSNATVKVGQGPTALNWNTAIDRDPAGGFGTASIVDPGEALTRRSTWTSPRTGTCSWSAVS